MNRRINRATFWLIFAIAIVFDLTLGYFGSNSSAAGIVFAIFCVYRLHDLGRTGKWVLLVIAVQLVGALISIRYVPEHQISTAMYFLDALLLPFVLWLGSTPGEPVSNGWGGPPPPGIGFGRN